MLEKLFPLCKKRIFLIQWKATIIPHSLLFLIDQNIPFYFHEVLGTLPEQASLNLYILMCPALYVNHCRYIKRVTCPRAGEEDLKDTEESVSVGKGQNGCHYRETMVRQGNVHFLAASGWHWAVRPLWCVRLWSLCWYDYLPRDRHKATCVRLLGKDSIPAWACSRWIHHIAYVKVVT